jgi:O-antigen ligase
VFQFLFGSLLGFTLLKFSNPPIMEHYTTRPQDVWQLVFATPWPITWAYAALAVVGVAGLLGGPFSLKHLPRWCWVLPAAWVAWTFASALQSNQPQISQWTVAHFAGTVVCFYLGLVVLSQRPLSGWFWLPLLACFGAVLAMGWDQHFGGLEQSRKYFMTYVYPQNPDVPPEFFKKLTSTRIFSTLFYPNALAAALLLLLPALTAYLWQVTWATPAARRFLAVVMVAGAAGCLYWSGSKAGWLLLTGQLMLALVIWRQSKASRRERMVTWGLIALVAITAVSAFAWKYSSYFQAGATSVSARFDYWNAAKTTALKHPLLGTGPGTFAKAYAALKRPEAEMARLAHNDYLQQASDSGLPAAILFAALVAGLIWVTGRHVLRAREALPIAVWIGVLAGAVQSAVEFGLYLPSMAWPMFALLGWLMGTACRVTPSGPGRDEPPAISPAAGT